MKCLVVAALVVAAVGSPLPDDCEYEVVGYSGAVPFGPHYATQYSSIPGSAPFQHYQATYATGGSPAVIKATAEFMAAWNAAAARAARIQSTLVKSAPGGGYIIQVPKQVEATREVQQATAQFMSAWNQAAQRAATVEHAVDALPKPVEETAEVQRATAEFMAAWEAAAQQASSIRQAVTVSAAPYSGVPRQVEATEEVKRATTEFMAAWRKAAARVPSIQTTLYTISGTAPSHTTPTIVGGVPQFTPSVAQATAEFMKAWNAAAAAARDAPDVNIIMGSRSQPRPAQPALPYAAAPSPAFSGGVPQPVQPTPEVQRATAAFMAAWNKAAARASTIQATLVKTAPSGRYVYEVPSQVKETEEVRRATAEFMAAWNAAAQGASVVEQAIGSLPQPVQQTAAVQRATAEFMASWEAAAQQASAIRQAVTVSASPYSGAPRPVEATDEVKRATAEFMAAWRKAAARVPSIQTTLYTISGTAPAHTTPTIVGGVPQFTPSVAQATAEFMKVWNAAAAAARDAPDVNIIMGAGSRPRAAQPAAPSAPAAVSYAAAPSPAFSGGVPQPVQPTPEVQRATAAFMAAWNAAAERATKIQATQVQDTAAVKAATTEFMAAWNAAARRATVVEQAISTLPKQVDYTEDVKTATAEFMASWHAAAQRASDINRVVSVTTYGVPQQVQPTREVQKATAEFMAAWNAAAARVPKIETTFYTLSGSSALDPARAPQPVSDTPEVKAAKAAFMAKFRAAQAAATRASVSHGVLPAPAVLSVSPAHHIAYSSGSLHHGYTISDRIFAPFSGFPIYVKDCDK